MDLESPHEANLNNTVPKRRNVRQTSRGEEKTAGRAPQVTADSKTRSVEGLMVSLSSHFASLCFLYILNVWARAQWPHAERYQHNLG